MHVFRPTSGSNTWAVDVSETTNNFTAPVTPFDVTATGKTTVASNTVSIFTFYSTDKNTWAIQTGGFTNAGTAQYRNSDPSLLRHQSFSTGYQIKTSQGTTGSLVDRQATLGGDPGRWFATTFKEQSASVTVSDAGDELFYNTETGVVVTCTGAGATKGAGALIISPSDNINDAGAITQTTTAWADTSVTFTASLSTFTPFAQLYLFVKNNSAQSNSSGFLVKRESRATVTMTLKNLAGSSVTSLSNIRYRLSATTINGTLLLSGLTETTDGSGIIDIGPYTLTEGGPLAPNDDAWVTLAIEGASQAASKGTCVKVTPTYS